MDDLNARTRSIPIKYWPALQRPRERLLAFGARSLSDGELLAIFLGSGSQDESAVDNARKLIDAFGSLPALLRADRASVLSMKGVGPARYAILRAAVELTRRCVDTNLVDPGA